MIIVEIDLCLTEAVAPLLSISGYIATQITTVLSTTCDLAKKYIDRFNGPMREYIDPIGVH